MESAVQKSHNSVRKQRSYVLELRENKNENRKTNRRICYDFKRTCACSTEPPNS